MKLSRSYAARLRAAAAATASLAAGAAFAASTLLSDAPVVTSNQVPPNVMMTLSVEWPTGTVAAYNDNASTVAGFDCPGRDSGLGVCYYPSRTYLGYFDPLKCYAYDATAKYFIPKTLLAALPADCSLSTGRWSGNYLNWSTMHAIDEFRYAMTGGDRYVDTATETVIEKSRHTGQGGHTQFPIKRVRDTAFGTVPATAPSKVTPETWSALYTRITTDGQPLWNGSTRQGQVMQIANNTAFLNAIGSAKFVRVQLLSSTGILSLAEVQVRNSSGTNIATAGTATQSSTNGSYLAKLANDNNTNGAFAAGSVTMTNSAGENQPWWQVALTASTALSQITLYGRTDSCCTARLANFYVFASASDMTGKTLAQLIDDPTVWRFYQKDQVPDDGSGVRRLNIQPASTDLARDAMNVRVRVCDSTVGLESNCKVYGSSTKPTGVIQENADKVRFGVSAYLNVDGTSTMGGVLRSPLKYVGSETIVPAGTPADNPHKEIRTDGTLVADPDAQVAADIVSSGVINYLNKFGKTGTKWTLKSQDPVSEMYYEALRYMRGFDSATSSFVNYAGATTPAARDGFPAYTDWTFPTWTDVSAIDKRPIQYSCQKNYFVGIGDTNTWCDTWGPGSTLASGCPGHTGGPSDSAINAATLADTIGVNEGNLGGGLGSRWISDATGRSDGYYISSYAYWANISDISTDDVNKSWTKGKQTAQTYWVDVRETGSFNGIVAPKNQYWLAGRYGGFDSSTGNLPPASFDPVNKNYFTGERPDTLISSLRTIFKSILSKQATSVPSSLSSNNLSVGSNIFQVQFLSPAWTGEVVAYDVSLSADGVLTAKQIWTAADKLDALNWSSGRKIVTWNPTVTAKGVPFLRANLTATQQTYFGATSAEQTDVINYLRGDRTYETATSTTPAKYRARNHVLGDIVNAEPLVVGKPNENFSDEFNPGFFSFVAAKASRTPVLYVGANDGMLHAFNASATGGNELFAYVPSAVLSGPTLPLPTPSVDGIAGRASLTYDHRYLVDQGPLARSVDFNRTGGSTSTGDWRTLLVGGLGKGGRSYYAIDVTDPSSWTSEASVASKVLWEFTDADMGFTYGQPVIAKTKAYGWVVMVTSGYNNTTGATVLNRGKGFLYILNAKTGALIKKIGTGAGTETDPSGFAKIIGFTPDSTDFTVDSVYGGDLLGNLWRFDLTSASGAYPAPTKIAQFKIGTVGQPITTAPRVDVYPGSLTRWVFVGTGRLLDSSDRSNSQKQSFYALKDGIQTHFLASSELPSGLSFPLDRNAFTSLSDTDLLAGITDPDPNKIGWLHDLSGVGANNATERLVDPIRVNSGLVVFTTKIPDADPCSSGLLTRVYVLDYTTGGSQIVDSGDKPIAFWSPPEGGSTASGDVVIGKGGNAAIVVEGPKIGPDLKKGPGGTIRLNWRELLQ